MVTNGVWSNGSVAVVRDRDDDPMDFVDDGGMEVWGFVAVEQCHSFDVHIVHLQGSCQTKSLLSMSKRRA